MNPLTRLVAGAASFAVVSAGVLSTPATGGLLPEVELAAASTSTLIGNLVATQGATEPTALSVTLTWDRPAAAPVGYEVLRDGLVLARTTVNGDSWDDMSYRDTGVTAGRSYTYQVRPVYGADSYGGRSAPAQLTVRSDAQLGGGRVYAVDQQVGTTDRAKAQAAINAAKSAGGGVVLFGARTYVLDGQLDVTGTNDVVLRGAGADRTVVAPSFAGQTDACANGAVLVNFWSGTSTLAGTHLTAPVAVDARTVAVDSTAEVRVGQRIVFYEPAYSSSGAKLDYVDPSVFAANGIAEDPGTPRDARKRWEANEVVAVDATSRQVTFKHPFTQQFSTRVPWVLMRDGKGNGIERMTLQGRSATEQTFYRLVSARGQQDFTMADVRGRWANRNYLFTSGYNISVIGFRGRDAEPNTGFGTCRYKISAHQTSNLTVVDAEIGDPSHGASISHITVQSAPRALVRSSKFWRSRSYAFNEHGQGSQDWVFENNLVSSMSSAGVSIGNSQWGFSGRGVIRGNTFENNRVDVEILENSHGVRVVDNVMRGTTSRVLTGYTWGASATPSDLRGAARWVVLRNTVSGAAAGIVLGERKGAWFPNTGVRDVLIADNVLGTSGAAISLLGDAATTVRFAVHDNRGSGSYVRPALVAGDSWSGNVDGVSYGTRQTAAWMSDRLAWETRPGPVESPTAAPSPTSPSPAPSPTPSPVTSPAPSPSASPAAATSPAAPVIVNDAVLGTGLNQFQYSGTWSTGGGTTKYRGDDHYSAAVGAATVLRWSGRQVSLFGTRASHHGLAEVSVDGGAPVLVDLYSSVRSDQVRLWTSPLLTAGPHTLTVKVTGKRRPASTGSVVTVDRVDVG